jgi:hypothetical protein
MMQIITSSLESSWIQFSAYKWRSQKLHVRGLDEHTEISIRKVTTPSYDKSSKAFKLFHIHWRLRRIMERGVEAVVATVLWEWERVTQETNI